ncbi:MAG: TonB-dependent receptor [Acidobacteriota bacterium]|nr:TonB-dependent receptor [Acidobacteriota bacterium]
MTSYGGLGRYATVSLRGSAADQVAIYIDGVLQNPALGGAVDLSGIPASQVASIRVYRGAPPAALGLEGMGGAIDIRTRGAGPDGPGPRLQGDFLAGSLETRRITGQWRGNLGAGRSLSLGFESLDSEGAFTFLSDNGTSQTTADDGPRRRLNNRVRARHGLLRLAAGEVAGGPLAFSLRWLGRERGLPGTESLPALAAASREEHWDLTGRWSRGSGRPGGADAWSAAFDLRAHRDRLTDPEGELGFGARDQLTRTAGGGLRVAWRGSRGGHRLLGRLELRSERSRVREALLDLSDRGGLRRRTFSLVVEDSAAAGRGWWLSAAGRLERRRDDFVSPSPGLLPPPADDLARWEWGGRLAAARQVRGGVVLRAALARTVHVPGLDVLFGDRGAVLGNPALRPETAVQLEWGAVATRRAGRGRLEVELSAWARRSRDLIVLLPISFGRVRAQNLDRATGVGLEGKLRLSWREGWSAEAGGSLSRLRDRSGGIYDGHRLVGRADRQGYLALRARPGKWEADYEVSYLGPVATDRLDTAEGRLPSRAIHDLRVGRRLGRGLAVHVEVRNLLDSAVRDVARFPLPGRSLYLHLGWKDGR